MLCLFLVMKMSAVPQKKSTGPIQWPERSQVMYYGTIFLVRQDYDMVNCSLKRLSLKEEGAEKIGYEEGGEVTQGRVSTTRKGSQVNHFAYGSHFVCSDILSKCSM
ncbi:hypothetical protein FKM82_026507 [Ascaphus truei]